MKTSKVKTVSSVKPWTGQNGTVNFHNLIMENGDKINIGKKDVLTAGAELTYELSGGDDEQQEYKKAKSVKPQGAFNQAPKDTGVITMLSCISSACNAVAQSSKAFDTAYILTMAENFFAAAMKKTTLNK